MEFPKLKFDQDLCGTFDLKSTLGSVVPLAMFTTYQEVILIKKIDLGFIEKLSLSKMCI